MQLSVPRSPTVGKAASGAASSLFSDTDETFNVLVPVSYFKPVPPWQVEPAYEEGALCPLKSSVREQRAPGSLAVTPRVVTGMKE